MTDKRRVGTIQIDPQHRALAEELVDKLLEAEREVGSALLNLSVSKGAEKRHADAAQRRDKLREAVIDGMLG